MQISILTQQLTQNLKPATVVCSKMQSWPAETSFVLVRESSELPARMDAVYKLASNFFMPDDKDGLSIVGAAVEELRLIHSLK